MAKENQTKELSVFETLNSVNVNEHIEKKNNLSYLPWAWAWAEVKKKYPNAFYTIYENANGLNYHTDGKTCWVKTGVTIEGLELIEYLPVMTFNNKSILLDKVESFDVNKAIQRSLTKACARHGLGLYVYAGEDLPEEEQLEQQQQVKQPVQHTKPAQKTQPKQQSQSQSNVPTLNEQQKEAAINNYFKYNETARRYYCDKNMTSTDIFNELVSYKKLDAIGNVIDEKILKLIKESVSLNVVEATIVIMDEAALLAQSDKTLKPEVKAVCDFFNNPANAQHIPFYENMIGNKLGECIPNQCHLLYETLKSNKLIA